MNIWDFILADMDKGQVRGAVQFSWRFFLVIFVIYAFGGLAFVGADGFVMAGNLREKIDAAVQPLKDSIAQMHASQTNADGKILEVNTRLIALQKQSLESKLLDFRTRQCKASNADAAANWRTLVSEYQDRYRAVTGESFILPACSDL